jgi:hypothetical protein
MEEYSHSIVNAQTKESTMKLSHLVFATLSLAAVAAHADDADPSGQFALRVGSDASRAQVQSQLADYRQARVNPLATSYNPLRSFQGTRSREEVRAEYLASRAAVAAMTAEDSGSNFLATRRSAIAPRQLAGDPFNAQ